MAQAYNRNDLEDLTKEQLMTIANEEFGLGVKPADNKEKITLAILERSGNQKKYGTKKFDGFPREDGVFEVPPKYAVIEIMPPQWDIHKRPVPLGHNGKFIYAPVERPIMIHEKYLNILRDAKREMTRQRETANRRRPETYYTVVPSYPHQIYFHNKTDEIQEFSP